MTTSTDCYYFQEWAKDLLGWDQDKTTHEQLLARDHAQSS